MPGSSGARFADFSDCGRVLSGIADVNRRRSIPEAMITGFFSKLVADTLCPVQQYVDVPSDDVPGEGMRDAAHFRGDLPVMAKSGRWKKPLWLMIKAGKRYQKFRVFNLVSM